MSADQFAREHPVDLLGISDFTWDRFENGSIAADGRLFLRPRDMVKIGQLVLKEGITTDCRWSQNPGFRNRRAYTLPAAVWGMVRKAFPDRKFSEPGILSRQSQQSRSDKKKVQEKFRFKKQ